MPQRPGDVVPVPEERLCTHRCKRLANQPRFVTCCMACPRRHTGQCATRQSMWCMHHNCDRLANLPRFVTCCMACPNHTRECTTRLVQQPWSTTCPSYANAEQQLQQLCLEDILGGRNLEETVWNQLCAHLAQLDLLEPEELIALVEFLSKRKLMKLRATHAPGERTAPADPTDVVSASSGGPRESSAHPELIEAVRSSPTTRPTQTEVCKECGKSSWCSGPRRLSWGQGAWWCQDCWQRWREAQ
jgi:hypothetical protein